MLDTLPSPLPGERLVILGNSGQGKSVLAKNLVMAEPNVIVVDTKHDEDWSDVGEIKHGEEIYGVGEGRYVWKTPNAFTDDERHAERFFSWALTAGNRVIYIDEYGDVCPGALTYPLALRRCIMRGRSRKLSIWGTTQEPIRCPSFLIGQAQHLYVFATGHPTQRKTIDQVFEQPVPWQELRLCTLTGIRHSPKECGGHQFLYKGPYGIYGPLVLETETTT